MAQLAAWALAAASAGASQVTISEWDVPTANSRPHDPAAAPDGALWFTEQMANKLGRLDPRSGRIREFPLKTAESGPHGLVVDRDGSVWFAAIFKGYVGRLDPRTGEIAEYRIPDPDAQDPHTPVLEQHGILWFTMEHSGSLPRPDR